MNGAPPALPTTPPAPAPPAPRPRTAGGILAALTAAGLSGFYLLNFTFGVLELPDNLPLVGNLDEVTAAWVLFNALAYLGIDLMPFLRRGR